MLFFVERSQQANAHGDNYFMFSGGAGRDQRRQGFDPFFMGLARLCSWSHMCTGCTYTYTPVSFYRKSMAGYIRLALCINNASCAPSLCRPSPFYSLPPLFAGASAEQRPHRHSKKCLRPLIHGVLHGLQKLQGLNP
jgi:hypothetical protein